MLKDNKKTSKVNPTNRAYMGSYDWNYLVLEAVDYIEQNFSSPTDSSDSWKHFEIFCSLRGLNWRVIKKMIEYTIAQPLNSEADLIRHEAVRPLELKTDNIDETMNVLTKKEPLEISFDFNDKSPKEFIITAEDINGAFCNEAKAKNNVKVVDLPLDIGIF